MNPQVLRISIDPAVCFDKPWIRGTRIWVSLALDFLSNGMAFEEILAEHPQLTEEGVRAAIAHRAEMPRERYVEVPVGVAGWSSSSMGTWERECRIPFWAGGHDA